jgi:hypothetical protein
LANNNKVLILCNTSVFPANLFAKRGVDLYAFYPDKLNVFLKLCRRATLSLGVLRKIFWYGPWFNKLQNYERIIIFAINGIQPIVNDISFALRTGVKPIVFFWDPVFRVKECLNYPLAKWSFDIGDCQMYQMSFNSTFYFKEIVNVDVGDNLAINNDIYFTGLIKGRANLIQDLENQFQSLGIKSNFILIEDGSKSRTTFLQNLKNINQTSAILDVVQDGQCGLTVRVMESIFWKKKLVTNNKNIIHEKFYDPTWIFILGLDKLENLKHFINSRHDISRQIEFEEFYDFGSWISRFNQE